MVRNMVGVRVCVCVSDRIQFSDVADAGAEWLEHTETGYLSDGDSGALVQRHGRR